MTRRRRDGADGPVRRRVPFLWHALAEYVLGAALVLVGVHVTGAPEAVLVGVGAFLILLNLCTEGPLGALRVLRPRAHHLADLTAAVALVASPLVALGELHVTGVLAAEVVGLVLLRIERTTRYGVPPPAAVADPAVRGSSTAVAAFGAVPRTGPAPSLPPSVVAARAVRQGARSLGIAVGVSRRIARERAARTEPTRRPDQAGSAGS